MFLLTIGRWLLDNPVRTVTVAALCLALATAGLQTLRLHSAEADVIKARADASIARSARAEALADEAICAAANKTLAGDVDQANEAVAGVAAACNARIREEAAEAALRATQALNRPRSVIEGTGAGAMNAWIETYP